MGAISSESSIQILKRYLNDPNRTVRETCEIALAKIEWDNSPEGKAHQFTPTPEDRCVSGACHPPSLTRSNRMYTSIDPAPPTSGLLKGKPAPEALSLDSIESLRVSLIDPALPLFERYRAMFALRNIGTNEAVDALASGFTDDSALFKFVSHRHHYPVFPLTNGSLTRHEIAFVFGQLLSPHSVPALVEVLRNEQESDMVRHEAAEALGGIGTQEVLPHLKEWLVRDDSPRVVRESCQVAIDMWEVRHLHSKSSGSRYLIILMADNRFVAGMVPPPPLITSVRKFGSIPVRRWA